jgi:hypothetical protein
MESLTTLARRIDRIEKRLSPPAQTAFDRELLRRLEEGRDRVRKAREARGLPERSDEGLPPRKVHTSRGVRLIVDILKEGRERARLRGLRDRGLLQSPVLRDGQIQPHVPNEIAGPNLSCSSKRDLALGEANLEHSDRSPAACADDLAD